MDDSVMDAGELITRWTVRVAVVLYVASLASRGKWCRVAWTAGCIAYLLHVVAAFHYYHHWSHVEAYAFTAQQTHEVVGLDWGGGLYVNYVFTLAWIGHTVWWWLRGRIPQTVEWFVQGFLGFVVFNATVVFATGFSRWFGIGACVLLGVIFLLRLKERKDADRANLRCPRMDGCNDR